MSTEIKAPESKETEKEEVSKSPAVDVAAVEKLAAEKIAAEQRAKELEKKLQAIKEEQKQRDSEIESLKKSFEEVKKKTMTKEELELQERKELEAALRRKDEALEQLRKEAEEANLAATRMLVAQQEGVPSTMIKFLRGKSEDEIRLEARDLIDNAKKIAQPSVVTERKVTEVGSTTTANTDSTKQAGQSDGKGFKGTLKDLREELVKRNFDATKFLRGQ